MLSSSEYIRSSMEYNLFWARIMKEHAIFIESSMPPSQGQLAQQARYFKQQFSALLTEVIKLSNGIISRGALQSGQYYTQYTEAAEQAVAQLTGIDTDVKLTQLEYNIEPLGILTLTPQLEESVSQLNAQLLQLTKAFAQFKSDLLNSQSACWIFTFLYTADINHVLHEAMKYIEILTGLQNRDEHYNQNFREFWNRNMADHAKSMRGQFDPTETLFFQEANRYANLFDALTAAPGINALKDTQMLSAFKAETTHSLLACKLKSIMSPLFSDHNQREANHYIYLLEP